MHTYFGTSTTFYFGTQSSAFEGSCQENFADVLLHSLVSVMLIRFLYLKAVVPPHCIPISRPVFSLDSLLRVDYTGLNVLNFSTNLFLKFVEACDLLNAWNFALKVSGGESKLKKFFGHSRIVAGIITNAPLQHPCNTLLNQCHYRRDYPIYLICSTF